MPSRSPAIAAAAPPEADADVQQQGNLQIHGTYGEPPVCAAGAREADARFDVEGQTAVEQHLVRHFDMVTRACFRGGPKRAERDLQVGEGRAAAHGQHVLRAFLRRGRRDQQHGGDERQQTSHSVFPLAVSGV